MTVIFFIDFFKVVRENFTIPGKLKLLICLRFYAVGEFLESLGDLFGVSKSSASEIVSEVSFLICQRLKDRYIRMPQNELEVLRAKAMFHRIGRFPLVIGAIDGTHIRVESFGGNDAEVYRNRKSYFSLNCQMVASADVSIGHLILLHTVIFAINWINLNFNFKYRCVLLMFLHVGVDLAMMLQFLQTQRSTIDSLKMNSDWIQSYWETRLIDLSISCANLFGIRLVKAKRDTSAGK